MAQIIPDGQGFHDLKDGQQIFVTRVTIATSADHVVLPSPADDASVLGDTELASDTLQFYLGGGSKPNVFNIDNGTAGDQFVVVSKHTGMVNYGAE
jgi:hypothetical protein